MSTRKEIISGFYGQYDEDGRTCRSRHGQLEYNTTMAYIHRYADKHSKVLEVGAGTGRYSIALAKEGMNVTAVELVESNLAFLKENSKGIENITSFQGDATDLRRFTDAFPSPQLSKRSRNESKQQKRIFWCKGRTDRKRLCSVWTLQTLNIYRQKHIGQYMLHVIM